MKYVILIGDGMADRPLKQLGGRTPLEAAKTPNMDLIAQKGICGMVRTIPKGVKPGSDTANLSIFGYDPKKYYPGRGPLEAYSRGIKLGPRDVAYRCNLVTIKGGRMKDFSAGHITTGEARKVITFLNKKLGSKKVRFYPGVSYRHILLIEGGPVKAKCTPPHDISGRPISGYLPKGQGAKLLNDLMKRSFKLLAGYGGKANMIWIWGQGKTPSLKKFPLKGSVITAVDLIKGIGKAIGLKVINVPRVTGYLDTNYIGKAKYALASLKNNDFVFVHVESPDESGHEGNIRHKVKAIQDFDKYVVGTILKGLRKFKDYRLMVLPDHPTPIALRTHTADPVPFAIYSSGMRFKGAKAYSEKDAKRTGIKFKSGPELTGFFLNPRALDRNS